MNLFLLFVHLAAAVLITCLVRPLREWSVGLSIGACVLSFATALSVFLDPEQARVVVWTWMELPGLKVTLGGMADPLARIMLLVVTGVGLLIHIFAVGYMWGDPGISRFFAKLSFFMFSMLGVVLADNLVMMFIFWELVGLSSYLLIGFWFERPSAADAAKKAFIVNRLGDFGFLLGILGVWAVWGTLDFSELQAGIARGQGPGAGVPLALVAFGLFMGCVGKSAQFPLHVWLPDAMEGPTPVSALIHAATMVAAGVYMLCRVFFILALSTDVLLVIAGVGMVTALGAGLVALQQNDIKRILAYSTLSQLGYMVAAVGAGAPAAAMFHLTTHAFFKALLFLAAGSVIHALHHEQDIWKMGGLWRKMPWTAGTFLVGTMALTGFPWLAGFMSKEAILASMHGAHLQCVFWLGVATAGLTAAYMGRLWWVAFMGAGRSEAVAHAREAQPVMTVPLVVLAGLSIGGGFLPVMGYLGAHGLPHGPKWLAGLSVAVFAAGSLLAWRLYRGRKDERLVIPFLARKFWVDEFYGAVFVGGQQMLARGLAWLDRWILGTLLVRGTAATAYYAGELLRLLQNGNVQAYATLLITALAALLYWVALVWS